MTSHNCAICLESVSAADHLSQCCGSWLCSGCFFLLDDSIIQTGAISSSPTCDYCGFTIKPINANQSVANIIVAATEAATVKITDDLESIKRDLDLTRVNLVAVTTNATELNHEITNNKIGAGAAELSPQQLASLRHQLDVFSSSTSKNYQLTLDELLSWQNLLCCRLQTLSRGVINDQISLLSLAKTWSLTKILTIDRQNYRRHVFWRHYASKSWQLIPVEELTPSNFSVRTNQVIPAVKTVAWRHSGEFFTRLLDNRLALVKISPERWQIIVQMTAVVKNKNLWQANGDVDVTLIAPKSDWMQLGGYGLGLTNKGYYFYYSVNKTVPVILVVHDFAVPDQGDIYQIKTYHIELSSQPSGQVYRYDNTLVTILNGHLTVIKLNQIDPDQGHIISTSPQPDLHIRRREQDQLFVNWSNKQIWLYDLKDLAGIEFTGRSDLDSGLWPNPIKKLTYYGPQDYRSYIEIIAPGVAVFVQYQRQLITTAYNTIYKSGFSSVEITGDGVLLVV